MSPAPVGAAYGAPLERESLNLENYKHAAPNGAILDLKVHVSRRRDDL